MYKEGDMVLIKSLDWYNNILKDFKGNVIYGFSHPHNNILFTKRMKKYCGMVCEVRKVKTDHYILKCEQGTLRFEWTDSMIERKIEL